MGGDSQGLRSVVTSIKPIVTIMYFCNKTELYRERRFSREHFLTPSTSSLSYSFSAPAHLLPAGLERWADPYASRLPPCEGWKLREKRLL